MDSPISFTPFFLFFFSPLFFTARERGKGEPEKTLYNTNPTTPRQQEETLVKSTNKMVKEWILLLLLLLLYFYNNYY
jgi:hypothetical protein